MMLKMVSSPTIVILTAPEVSFMLPENVYSTGVSYDLHLRLSKYFYSIGHRFYSIGTYTNFSTKKIFLFGFNWSENFGKKNNPF